MRMEANQKELAKILGLTERHIRRLRQESGLFAKEDGKRTYTLEKCVPEYISYKAESYGKSGSSFNKEKQQAEHEEIKKQISILKLRRLKGELHEATDVETFLTDMLCAFKNKLLGIPQKVAPLILGEDDSNVIIGILEKELYASLEELSEYAPLKIDGDTSALYEEEEDEEDEEV